MMYVLNLREPKIVKHAAERSWLVILWLPLTAAIVLSGCTGKPAQGSGVAGARPVAPVVVASVEHRDIPVQIKAIGNV